MVLNKEKKMEDQKKFVADFVEAARNDNDEEMKRLSKSVSEFDIDTRVELLEDIVAELKETGANPEIEAGLNATLQLVKTSLEAQENSTAEETKDESKVEEATQDVAADGSADEADEKEAVASTPVAESEGDAPAEEEKTEKSEQ